MCKPEKKISVFKVALVAAGILVAAGGAVALLYSICKRHLKITFEDDCCCENCIDDCLADSEELFDDCCCCDDEEEYEDEPAEEEDDAE